jgi:hypothetical protein
MTGLYRWRCLLAQASLQAPQAHGKRVSSGAYSDGVAPIRCDDGGGASSKQGPHMGMRTAASRRPDDREMTLIDIHDVDPNG